jgi:hypothetical protein
VASEFVSGTCSQSVWDAGNTEESSAFPEELSVAEVGGPVRSPGTGAGGPGMPSDSDTDGAEPSSDWANASGAIQIDADPIRVIRIVASSGVFVIFRFNTT